MVSAFGEGGCRGVHLCGTGGREATSKSQLAKLHLQLGRADCAPVMSFLRKANQTVDEKLAQELVLECGCGRACGFPQRRRINRYVPTSPGETVEMDIFYPAGVQSKPCVITVCSFTRYVMARFIPNLQPRTLVSFLLLSWSMLMGMPKYVLEDNGKPFWASIGFK